MDTKKAHQQVNSSQWHLGMDHSFCEGGGGGGGGGGLSGKKPPLREPGEKKVNATHLDRFPNFACRSPLKLPKAREKLN